ncbi:MAG: biotin--[acetyl-CoA-carboxylase] ligase [Ferruginibacter sp.]|nr:biotin--[acetyl-CoA-carboxylase] ligase [Ferruginibacter sp.]
MGEAGFFTILDTVDSTNNYAMRQLHDGLAKHGQAWFATEQTAGKGQRGKSWASQKGKNIAMSLVLEPAKCKIESRFHLSALVALCCLDFLKMHIEGEIKIKWPNDLYWRDRKTGGILIENKLQGRAWKWAVVGIGININQDVFSQDLKRAISLKQITGKAFDVIELAKQLQLLLMKKIDEGITLNETIQHYNEKLYKKDEPVTLKKANIKFDTIIKGISTQGKLQTVDAIEREFDFGEVEWVL